MQPIRNFCIVEVAQGYASIDAEISLVANEGLKLPDPVTEGIYNLVWFNFTDYKNPSDDPYKEIIKVTAKDADKLTIKRGQEGIAATDKKTTGKTYKLLLTLTKENFDEIIPGYHGQIQDKNDGNITPVNMGISAVDFQFNRTKADQTAQGDNSFIAGGGANRATGACSFAANIGNTSSSQGSSSFGIGNIASGESSFVIGQNNIAEEQFTFALGYGAKARLLGQVARAAYYNAAAGDQQSSNILLKGTTNGEEIHELHLNLIGGVNGRIILENNTSYLFKGLLIGRGGNTLSVGYEIKGLIARGENAASTQVIGNITVERISDMSLGCDCQIEADTANGSLKISVTGEKDIAMKWFCSLEWVEIKG